MSECQVTGIVGLQNDPVVFSKKKLFCFLFHNAVH